MAQVKNIKTVMAQLNLKPIEVAVAIIPNSNGKILITQRSHSTSHPGSWEFPGGKLDRDETPRQCLFREALEEIGINIHKAQKISKIQHDYINKSVILHVYMIEKYSGQARCCEDQINLHWAEINELQNYKFPEANISIIELIKKLKNIPNQK